MSDLILKDILLKSTDFLLNKGIENARYEMELLLCHFLSKSRMDLYLDFDSIVSTTDADKVRQAVIERGKRKPLQYIIGSVPFLDCIIDVDENVLIPRPETEYMVDTIIQNAKNEMPNETDGKVYILDLCTGSGCIAIALKKRFPNARVIATDICENTLEIATRNAQNNGVEIIFVKSNILDEVSFHISDFKFQIIVSNPPYISETVYPTLAPEIFFEPKIALIAANDGLYFYEKIISQARDFLIDTGTLYLEIGANQAPQIRKLTVDYHYSHCEIVKDLTDRDRVAKIKK